MIEQQKLEQISGAGQVSTGSGFQPVVFRVTNSATPPNPVMGAAVSVLTTVLRSGGVSSGIGSGDGVPGNPAMPVILSAVQNSATTGSNGLVSVVPGSGGFSAPVEIDVSVSAGASAFLDDALFLLPAVTEAGGSSRSSPPARHPIAAPIGRER